MTEIGQAYYQRCLAMRVEAESAAELIERNRSEPQGLVRLSCPTALLNSWVGPMLTRYMLKYPLVELFIESTNRRVDLIHEGFDIALRVRFPPLENTDMVMKVLGNSTQSVVGSPQFVERLSSPPSPADLNGLPSLHWGAAQREYQWELLGPNDNTALIRHTPRLVTDDLIALRQAVIAGVGVAHLPSVVVRGRVDSRLGTEVRGGACDLSVAARVAAVGAYLDRFSRRRVCAQRYCLNWWCALREQSSLPQVHAFQCGSELAREEASPDNTNPGNDS